MTLPMLLLDLKDGDGLSACRAPLRKNNGFMRGCAKCLQYYEIKFLLLDEAQKNWVC